LTSRPIDGIVPDYEVRSLIEFAMVMGVEPVTSGGGAPWLKA